MPARLDVMGGIADYSGSNVCEGVLGRGVLMGLQARTDRTVRIRTMHAGLKALPIETRLQPQALMEWRMAPEQWTRVDLDVNDAEQLSLALGKSPAQICSKVAIAPGASSGAISRAHGGRSRTCSKL